MTRTLAALCLAAAIFATACALAPEPRHTHERLHSTLYLQRSAEYPAACLQAYRTATERLDAALKDPAWTAEQSQTGDLSALPPAVILDVDETVLDNSPYYSLVINRDEDFDLKQWNRWVVRAEAELVPGVADFIAAAQKAGVTVFLVTNRDSRLEAHTRLNIQQRGITLDPLNDTLLMFNERSDWRHDKQSRRAFIARTHRILMMFGDNLNDFTPIAGLDQQARKQLVADTAAYWGTRWFALPNPNYGNWLEDISRTARTDADLLAQKKAALRPAVEVSDEMMSELMKRPLPDFPKQIYIDALVLPAQPLGAPEPPKEEPDAPATPPASDPAAE